MDTLMMMVVEGGTAMKGAANSRRRPSVHITMSRAARLHRMVKILADKERCREDLLRDLGIGLRTFYRELELLKRCGVKVRLQQKSYVLQSTAEMAEGKLPFPDPQLSFAEMAELAQGQSPAAQRLKDLLTNVMTFELQRTPNPRLRPQPNPNSNFHSEPEVGPLSVSAFEASAPAVARELPETGETTYPLPLVTAQDPHGGSTPLPPQGWETTSPEPSTS